MDKVDLFKIDKIELKYKCLSLANLKLKMNDDGNLVQLSADEIIEAANKYYNFITEETKNG